jgi:hypothetical protein
MRRAGQPGAPPLNCGVRRHVMLVAIIRLLTLASLAVLVAPVAFAQAPLEKPTPAEVHSIETNIRMPKGAGHLRAYVRYYYTDTHTAGRRVAGIFIARSWLGSSEIPEGGITVVASEHEIRVPEDAGCSVVFVEYDPHNSSRLVASCGAEVIHQESK